MTKPAKPTGAPPTTPMTPAQKRIALLSMGKGKQASRQPAIKTTTAPQRDTAQDKQARDVNLWRKALKANAD